MQIAVYLVKFHHQLGFVVYRTRISYRTRMVYIPYAYGTYHTRTVWFSVPYAYGYTVHVCFA